MREIIDFMHANLFYAGINWNFLHLLRKGNVQKSVVYRAEFPVFYFRKVSSKFCPILG